MYLWKRNFQAVVYTKKILGTLYLNLLENATYRPIKQVGENGAMKVNEHNLHF